jgi:hypothetical protein
MKPNDYPYPTYVPPPFAEMAKRGQQVVYLRPCGYMGYDFDDAIAALQKKTDMVYDLRIEHRRRVDSIRSIVKEYDMKLFKDKQLVKKLLTILNESDFTV